MSWGLAHRAAEKAFLARGLNTVSPTTGKYSPQFLQLRAPQHGPPLPCPVPRWLLSWPARQRASLPRRRRPRRSPR
eukprot:1539869-Rhodomonas_salina.1